MTVLIELEQNHKLNFLWLSFFNYCLLATGPSRLDLQSVSIVVQDHLFKLCFLLLSVIMSIDPSVTLVKMLFIFYY